jgi:hypothetical protein
VLSLLEDDLAAKSVDNGRSPGGGRTPRQSFELPADLAAPETVVEDFDRALARLYREHVQARSAGSVTHLPRLFVGRGRRKLSGDNQESRKRVGRGASEPPAHL